jgi:hypothetical protein
MTQATFLEPVYLVDASSLIDLDGMNRYLQTAPPPAANYTPRERGLIWHGLEELAAAGRLKLIKQVREELERHDLAVLQRLQVYPGARMPPVRRDLQLRYKALLAEYRDLMPKDPAYDPADPWLIVAAQKWGYTIICEEVPAAQKTKRPKTTPIPDICASKSIPCVRLRRLGNDLCWIP